MTTKYIIDNLTGQTITGDITINGNLSVSGVTSIIPYKVYTALLTQSGDGTDTFTSGTLDVGKTYEIADFISGDDFTDVANVINGTINTNGCVFIATGTTPAVWAEGSELRDTSAPVSTVLENTIGNIWFTYQGVGNYPINSNKLFTTNKVFINNLVLNSAPDVVIFILNDSSYIEISTGAGDNVFNNTPIEIRVYN